jgi:hypothetical protein
VAITGQTRSRGGHAERRLYCMRFCHVYLVELAIPNQKKMKRRLLFSFCPPPFPTWRTTNYGVVTAAPCRTQVPISNQNLPSKSYRLGSSLISAPRPPTVEWR